ncbi:MobQ family relaxase [Ralstonia pickettii]|uniref:MobQ family relaxase n=1 Tax=Ralstonia pickettii TaxID=329 RepID=UPI00046A0FF9|nr:MobQ family relaxase [Ralstonia pickettii]
MASYHFTVKTVSRSAGRSATAAAAYRAGVEIADARTGEIHDYRRKAGVESAELVLPPDAPEWAAARSALWNAVEQAETRKNSTVAREFEIALPHELTPEVRKRLAADFAGELVQRHGFAVDVAIHAPGKKGDIRNHHAHVLCSTRRLTPEGIGEKTRELDDMKIGPQEVERWRERWAEMGGDALERAGFTLQAARYRAGHLPLEKQVQAARERGDLAFVSEHENREPTRHLGPSAVGFERRTGRASKKRMDFDQVAAERLAQAKRAGELERQASALDEIILDLTTTIAQAKAERDRQRQSVLRGTGVNIAELRERLERSKLKLAKLEQGSQIDKPKDASLTDAHKQTAPVTPRKRDDDFEP